MTTRTDTVTAAPYQPAGLLRRLGALLYDVLLVLAALFGATAVALALSHGDLNYTSSWFRLYLLSVIYCFFGWFWAHGGQTLGMRAWKIRIVSMDGSAVRWWQTLIRFIVVIGSLGLGLLWTLVDRDKQAIYDRLAKTRVERVNV